MSRWCGRRASPATAPRARRRPDLLNLTLGGNYEHLRGPVVRMLAPSVVAGCCLEASMSRQAADVGENGGRGPPVVTGYGRKADPQLCHTSIPYPFASERLRDFPLRGRTDGNVDLSFPAAARGAARRYDALYSRAHSTRVERRVGQPLVGAAVWIRRGRSSPGGSALSVGERIGTIGQPQLLAPRVAMPLCSASANASKRL